MKVIKKVLPKDRYSYYDDCQLASYDLDELEKMGIEEVRYFYGSAPYEGSGQMITLKDGRYDLHNMGHCSCYGPVEHFSFTGGYDSIEHLLNSCTGELRQDVELLVEGYEKHTDWQI